MILVYYRLNMEFDLPASGVSMIIVENGEEFERMCLSASDHVDNVSECFRCLDDDQNELDLTSYGDCIRSLFDLGFDKRKIQRSLLSELTDALYGSELEGMIAEIDSKVIEVLESLSVLSENDIEYTEDYSVSGFLKRYDVRMREPEGSFAERLITYCETMHRLVSKRLFFIINCDLYMDAETIELVHKWAVYQDVSVVFISGKQREDLNFIVQYIIDKDLCVIN